MICWGSEHTDSDGRKFQYLFRDGAIAAVIEQFPENAPTTYLFALGRRIGAFESWETAQSKARALSTDDQHRNKEGK